MMPKQSVISSLTPNLVFSKSITISNVSLDWVVKIAGCPSDLQFDISSEIGRENVFTIVGKPQILGYLGR
jgi:hypothetical protein